VDAQDLVIGSGLSALGAVLGLQNSSSVVVLAGPVQGAFSHYDTRRTVPCAYLGAGGLGNDWHGVIPTAGQHRFAQASDADFAALFAHFYPGTPVAERLGTPQLFVPWRPIRSAPALQALAAAEPTRIQWLPQLAQHISLSSGEWPVRVKTAGAEVRAQRLWLAAGALHTPGLLSATFGRPMGRDTLADHAFCYIGQVDGQPAPRIAHTRGGMFIPAQFAPGSNALYTMRPARFAFRTLDHGIEQRALFGLPTGSAVSKIMKRLSPALLAEAFFNRFGLFPSASRYSVYAQVEVPEAYAFTGDAQQPLRALHPALRAATDRARQLAPYAGLQPSQRPEIALPGIHLHDSLQPEALAAEGVNAPAFPLQVVDASVLRDIGPEHHSFKMMVAAYCRARAAVSG
jgi:hypothetical protein